MRHPYFENLKDGSTIAMNVNGATTPKEYIFTADQYILVKQIAVVLADNAASDWNKFGGITALTNGLKIETVIGETTTQIALIKNNAQLANFFYDNQFGSTSLGLLSTLIGFGGSENNFIGRMEFVDHESSGILLGAGDKIKVTVQDNLAGLVELSMGLKLEKQIS